MRIADGRLAWREVRNRPRFSLFFILTLSLGLVGFVLVDAFKRSVEASIMSRSQGYLTADISVSGRRAPTSEELKLIQQTLGAGVEQVEIKDIYSMAAGSTDSRLVQLRAIDKGFPFYGDIQLERGGPADAKKFIELTEEPKLWVAPEILAQLNVQVGNKIKIGRREFRIDDVVTLDTGQAVGFGGLAPRIYLGAQTLKQTELVQEKGTLLYHYLLFKLPQPSQAEDIVKVLQERLVDPGLRVYSHRTASEQTARFLNYLNDYLGLVALVALFLAGVGAGYLYRSFLLSKFKDMAILLSLGLPAHRIRRLFLFQIAVLGAIAAIPSALLGWALVPLLTETITRLSPFQLEAEVSAQSLWISLLLGVFASQLLVWPMLRQIQKLKPSALFQESVQPQWQWSWTAIIFYAPLIAVFWGLAMWQSRSFKVGSLFTGAFLAAAVVLVILSWLILKFLAKRLDLSSLTWRFPLRHLTRQSLSTISCFLALALGVLLINFLQVIQTSLQSELDRPETSRLPDFFLIDIQEEQVQGLEDLLQEKQHKLSMLSPMILARLESVNGKAFEKRSVSDAQLTREAENEARFRNRGFNLSYREQLSDSEEVVKGQPWKGVFDPQIQKYPFISVEERFADRLDLKIGDILRFDVQGVPVEGEIYNLRKVRWSSFDPNFFVQFQTGVLEGAPKTFIGTIANVDRGVAGVLQNSIVREFPNISLINVSQAVERILSMIVQMSWALRFMAGLSFLAGLFVLYAIAQNQVRSRRRDMNMLKILGAAPGLLIKTLAGEFALLGLSAALFGILLSWIIGGVFAYWIFDQIWVFTWVTPLLSLIIVTALTIIVGWIAARRVIRARPVAFLND